VTVTSLPTWSEGNTTGEHRPISCREGPQLLLAGLGRGGLVQDPLDLVLDLPGAQQPARVVHPQSEEAALVVHRHKLAVLPVLEDICVCVCVCACVCWEEEEVVCFSPFFVIA